ncbi:tricarballylate/proton symporter TcuC [Methylobacterium sp. A54F]
MATTIGEEGGASRLATVLRVTGGNFLEMYDFFVFGYYAAAIGRVFFPSQSDFASLMFSLGTFGAAFLMRPLGAIVLGAYIDRHGRRAGLLLTLGLMAIGTLSIAIAPGYGTIGVLAPVIVVLGRLVQGFSAGAELGGVSVYLSEIATPGNKGFYVAWQSGSQQVAVIFAAALGLFLQQSLTPAQMDSFGWRIPLLIGCLIIPFLFVIRRSLQETPEFAHRKAPASLRQVWITMLANWRIVLVGMMMVTMTTVSFYLITVYTPTFGRNALKLDAVSVLIVTVCVGVSNLFWLPVMGALSDRIGRRPLLILFTALALVTAYPAVAWLADAPTFERLLTVELWLSFIYGSYNGAMVVYLTEIMPAEVRSAGFSLAYSLATAIFGGFTPAVCTGLIEWTGNVAMPGLWLSVAAAIGLAAALLARGEARRAGIPAALAS